MRTILRSVFVLALVSSLAGAAPAVRKTSLNKVVPDLNLTGVPLSQAIDTVQEAGNVNLHVNWRALVDQGVGRDTQVNLHVRNVSVRKALDLILSDAGAGDKLAYYADQGVIEITTRDLADHHMLTRIYPVGDLLLDTPQFLSPQISLDATNGSGGGSGGGGGGSGVFSGSNNATASNQAKTNTDKDRANDLINLIITSIRPDIWSQNGGPASIGYFNRNLVVTAPRSVHEAIGGSF